MTKYRYSINFDYFNTYTFASGNAGFYYDSFFKSKKIAEAHLLKIIKKEYPAYTYNIYSCSEAYYIMKIKCSWSSCWKQIKRAFIFNTPVIKLIQFLADAGENTHRYNLGKKLISWSLDFTN